MGGRNVSVASELSEIRPCGTVKARPSSGAAAGAGACWSDRPGSRRAGRAQEPVGVTHGVRRATGSQKPLPLETTPACLEGKFYLLSQLDKFLKH